MADKKLVNITPILNHLFGDFYGDPKKMELLIKGLREIGDKPLFDVKKMAQIMENIQAHQEKRAK